RKAVDEPAADDRAAADRGHCRNRGECAADADHRTGEAAARFAVPPAPCGARLDDSAGLMPLTAERCVACRRDAPTVTDAEAAELHVEIPDWEVVEIDGVRRLRRAFGFDDFAQALSF